MTGWPEGGAVVYCQGAYNTSNGKTAHGLVRFTRRYRVLSVVDARYAGQDAGQVIDGRTKNIPIYSTVAEAVAAAGHADSTAGKIGPAVGQAGSAVTHVVIGLAPDGGRLSPAAREDVKEAIQLGLNIDSGLHDFLSQDPEIADLAAQHSVRIRDVRKPPPTDQLHFFSGKIEQVKSLKVAILGTDSAIGKRTTAWILLDAIRAGGRSVELIGTGQTAWMQGARYGIILDSLINDFVTGEIEHAVWQAWNEIHPDVILIEGQGGLLNPAYPGGFEILAAARPDVIILQHAPTRKTYDGFPKYPIQPLSHQIRALEIVSGKPVVAITINHEGLSKDQIPAACAEIERDTGRPAFDVLMDGADELATILGTIREQVSDAAPRQ
jgi:uncharacterized NAD-dependent epimerase/dehydratase family protein